MHLVLFYIVERNSLSCSVVLVLLILTQDKYCILLSWNTSLLHYYFPQYIFITKGGPILKLSVYIKQEENTNP